MSFREKFGEPDKKKIMIIAAAVVVLIGGCTTVGVLMHRQANKQYHAEVSSANDAAANAVEEPQETAAATQASATTAPAPETTATTARETEEREEATSTAETTEGGGQPPAPGTSQPVVTQAPVTTTPAPVVTEPPAPVVTEPSKPANNEPTGNFSFKGMSYMVDESAGAVYENHGGAGWEIVVDGGARWQKFSYVWNLESVKDDNTAYKALTYACAATVAYTGCDVIYIPSYWTVEDVYNNYGFEVQGRLSFGTYVDDTGDGCYWYYG